MRDGTKARLRELHWKELEQLVADLWKRQSYETIRTQGRKDGNIDVIARQEHPHSKREYIEVKSGTTNVGVGTIRKCASLKLDPTVDAVFIVTTAEFTETALSEAKEKNVKPINGDRLAELIEECNAFDLIGISLFDEKDSGPFQHRSPFSVFEQQDSQLVLDHESRNDDRLDDYATALAGFDDLKGKLHSILSDLHAALQADVDGASHAWVGLRDSSPASPIVSRFNNGAHSLEKLTPARWSRLNSILDASSLTILERQSDWAIIGTPEGTITEWDPTLEAGVAAVLATVVYKLVPECATITRNTPSV